MENKELEREIKLFLKEELQDYCLSSSIHGVRYLGERGRPLIERILWIVIFALSSSVVCFLILEAWTKWQASPVIVSFDEHTTPIWEIPFPAVTVCPQAKSVSQVYTADSVMQPDLQDDKFHLRSDFSVFCNPEIIINGSLTMNETSLNRIIEMTPWVDHCWYCEWGEEMLDCGQTLLPLLTNDGVCFTFNMLAKEDLFRPPSGLVLYPEGVERAGWDLEAGYHGGAPLEAYPRRAGGVGAASGLYFIMKVDRYQEQDQFCRDPVPGFKILLHNPAEIPNIGVRYIQMQSDKEMTISMRPSVMKTSPALRSYRPDTRQCYFPFERFLKFFKVYTQRNCELECQTNYTLANCQCAAYYMPRTSDMPICGGGSKECVLKSYEELRRQEITASFEGNESLCGCLPACFSIEYETETSQVSFEWRSRMKALQMDEKRFENESYASLVVFFKDMQFISSRRGELYGSVDFIGNCGGLLGLFSGFSLLSLVEILYHLLIRSWYNFKRKRRQPDCAELGL